MFISHSRSEWRSGQARNLALLAALLGAAAASPARADNPVVARYVAEALEHNRALAQRALARDAAALDVDKAWGGFMPSLSLEARYSIVSGNALDLGALVNPAYATLNQLVGQQRFPTDVDARLPLTQETKLRLTQPLFALELVRNLELRSRLGEVADAELAAARRALTAEVQTTYLEWAKLSRVLALYGDALAVIDEGVRTTQALVDVGKVADDALVRLAAERAELEQKRVETARDRRAVGELLNFLRGAPLDAPLELSTASLIPEGALPTLDAVSASARRREELAALDAGIGAQSAVAELATARFFPTLAVAADYGIQGSSYRFTADDDLLVVSFVASWNLFRGFTDQVDRDKAELERQRLERQRDEVAEQLTLGARRALGALETTREALVTAEARRAAASRAFEQVQARYAAGAAGQLEFVDAQNRLTAAQINLALTEYDRQLRWVDLTRAAAL